MSHISLFPPEFGDIDFMDEIMYLDYKLIDKALNNPNTMNFLLLANGLYFIYIWLNIGFLGALLVLAITTTFSVLVVWVLGIYASFFR